MTTRMRVYCTQIYYVVEYKSNGTPIETSPFSTLEEAVIFCQGMYEETKVEIKGYSTYAVEYYEGEENADDGPSITISKV